MRACARRKIFDAAATLTLRQRSTIRRRLLSRRAHFIIVSRFHAYHYLRINARHAQCHKCQALPCRKSTCHDALPYHNHHAQNIGGRNCEEYNSFSGRISPRAPVWCVVAWWKVEGRASNMRSESCVCAHETAVCVWCVQMCKISHAVCKTLTRLLHICVCAKTSDLTDS